MAIAYDEEFINAVLGELGNISNDPKEKEKSEATADTNEEPVVDPFTDIKQPKLPTYSHTFSSLFWKPKSIPDIPINMFSPDDWHEEARPYIPPVNEAWVWDRPVTEAFALAMYCGDTTLLHGLQGTGKTCLPEQWCALLNIPFWRMSCNNETRAADFVGSPGLEYNDEGQAFIKQEPTLLTDSLRYGGMFVEDEAFRHTAAMVLQSLREKSNRTIILPDAPGKTAAERKLKAPEGKWWYILTDNTAGGGDETGLFDAHVQDASTLDRIDAVIEVGYLGKASEKKVLGNHSKLNATIRSAMCDYAKLVRVAFKEGTMGATMSVRGLLSWANKTELMGHLGRGLEVSWVNKLNKADRAVAEDMFHQVFGRKISDD